jgi:hypothetical protein
VKSAPETTFLFEAGRFNYYRYVGTTPVLQYSTVRVALAYDAARVRFERFGPPDDLMRWAATRRAELRAEGHAQEATDLHVVMLPRDLDVKQLNWVEENPADFIYFLQKMGLV